MHTYEVKFIYKEITEEMWVSNPFFENLKTENESVLQARNDAFKILQSVLKQSVEEKIIFFKDPSKDIFHDFDTEILKDENGNFNLSKIYHYPMFFNHWLLNISLFWNDKEIFRIGNIMTAKEYETILQNAREEAMQSGLDNQNLFGFHHIPLQDFYTFGKILKSMTFINEDLSSEELEEIMKFI